MWFRADSVKKTFKETCDHGVLTISSLSQEDRGHYVCQAQNNDDFITSDKVKVTVHLPGSDSREGELQEGRRIAGLWCKPLPPCSQGPSDSLPEAAVAVGVGRGHAVPAAVSGRLLQWGASPVPVVLQRKAVGGRDRTRAHQVSLRFLSLGTRLARLSIRPLCPPPERRQSLRTTGTTSVRCAVRIGWRGSCLTWRGWKEP